MLFEEWSKYLFNIIYNKIGDDIFELGICSNKNFNWEFFENNNYNWNYEQIIWNKMLWSQNLSISDCLKPEYAYQLMYYNIEQSNNFNNFDIKNAKIIHLAGTRHLFKLVNFIKENFNLEFKIN
jgi:hypothetical protein